MKKIRLILLSVIAIFLQGSCSDDFVEVDAPFENSDAFFNSEQDYFDALVGAYDLLQTTYLNVMIGEIASDNTLAGGENANDFLGVQEIDDMRHTPINQPLRDIWGWMYSGVNRANFILEFQDNTDFEGRENIIAQARFLRAYYYFELVKFFGDVPLAVDTRIQFGDQFNLDRTPASEVYDQIEEDLIFAAENMPFQQEFVGMATRGSALALLGKVYLYQDQFDLAANALE